MIKPAAAALRLFSCESVQCFLFFSSGGRISREPWGRKQMTNDDLILVTLYRGVKLITLVQLFKSNLVISVIGLDQIFKVYRVYFTIFFIIMGLKCWI